MNKFFLVFVCSIVMAISIDANADSSLPLKPAGFNWSMNAQQFANKCKSLGGKSMLKKPEGPSVFEYSMFCEGLHLPGFLKGYPIVGAGYLKSGHIGRFSYMSDLYENKNQWKKHISSTVIALNKMLGDGNVHKDNLPGDMKLAVGWNLENGTIQFNIFIDENEVAYDSIWIDTVEANNDMRSQESEDEEEEDSSNLIHM